MKQMLSNVEDQVTLALYNINQSGRSIDGEFKTYFFETLNERYMFWQIFTVTFRFVWFWIKKKLFLIFFIIDIYFSQSGGNLCKSFEGTQNRKKAWRKQFNKKSTEGPWTRWVDILYMHNARYSFQKLDCSLFLNSWSGKYKPSCWKHNEWPWKFKYF